MKYFFVLVLSLLVNPLLAQEGNTHINGIIIDKASRQPIEFVTVSLLNKKDSSILAAAITDSKGKFVLEDIRAGNFLVRYSYIGFNNSLALEITIKAGQENINLGIVELSADAKKMGEVVVATTKTTLNTSIDRKVYNVDQDIMSRSGAASDILKNIPSVEVDIDGQVSLRGSAEVLILINGKVSPLMGKTRAEVLQSLPANSIERIEVITNPSARYRPDGTSGIINIVLKKNTKMGWNGTLTTNAGNNSRYNGNLSLNYHPGKLNIYGSYGFRKDSRRRTNKIERTYLDTTGNVSGYFNESSLSWLRPLAHTVSLGMEYAFSKRNSVGISGNYYYRKLVRYDEQNKFNYNQHYVLLENYDRFRYDPEFERQTNITAFFKHKFAKEDHELKLEFSGSGSTEVENNQYRNIYYMPIRPTELDNTLIKLKDRENQLTLDYTLPISEESQLELGYDGSFNKEDLDFYGEYYDTARHGFVKDAVKTNLFLYKETIQAIYATYQRSFGAFGFSVGLRGEGVNIRGNLVTIDSQIKNNYFRIYPTLHLSYEIDDNNELQLNYSRRINRPDPDELNPFPEYSDPRNLWAGNPKLLPEFINSFGLGYKWQNKNYSFVPGLYYRYRTNGFTEVVKPINDSTLLTTNENLANDHSAGLELILSAKLGKFFSGNMSGNFFYNQVDASNLGYSGKRSIVSFSANINTSFMITKNSMLQLSANYRSARLTPQGKNYPRFVANIGMRQDMLKKKLSATLTVSDLFATGRDKRELNSLYLQQRSLGRRDVRICYIGISYRFGSTAKQKEQKMQFDTEQ